MQMRVVFFCLPHQMLCTPHRKYLHSEWHSNSQKVTGFVSPLASQYCGYAQRRQNLSNCQFQMRALLGMPFVFGLQLQCGGCGCNTLHSGLGITDISSINSGCQPFFGLCQCQPSLTFIQKSNFFKPEWNRTRSQNHNLK